MGLIESVGLLGLPRLPGVFDSTTLGFFDNEASSAVRHVHHAVAIHEHLSVMPPCLIETPDSDFLDEHFVKTVVTQKWFPGTHYDLGRTTFIFIPQYLHNYVNRMLGLIPSLLTRMVSPNKVLADCTLKWLLEGVQDVDESATQIIPDIDRIICTVENGLAMPAPNSTGNGDVYSNPLPMKPTNLITNAVRIVSIELTGRVYSALTRLLSSPLREENVHFKSPEHVVYVVKSVTDRRIPGSATNIYPY